MDAATKTRLVRMLTAMVVEAGAVVPAVVVHGRLAGTMAGSSTPLLIAAAMFVVISIGVLTMIAPVSAQIGGADGQGQGLRAALGAFVLGYIGNGALQAAVSWRDILFQPHGWADVAFLNQLSRLAEVGGQWPQTVARLVAPLLG